MKIHDSDRLVKFVAGAARTPKFLRKALIKNDHSGRLLAGNILIADFERPKEEDEFFQKMIDGPTLQENKGRGFRD